jgi:hypothetical protein
LNEQIEHLCRDKLYLTDKINNNLLPNLLKYEEMDELKNFKINSLNNKILELNNLKKEENLQNKTITKSGNVKNNKNQNSNLENKIKTELNKFNISLFFNLYENILLNKQIDEYKNMHFNIIKQYEIDKLHYEKVIKYLDTKIKGLIEEFKYKQNE